MPSIKPTPTQPANDPADGSGAYAVLPHEGTLGGPVRMLLADLKYLPFVEHRLGAVLAAQRRGRIKSASSHAILGVLTAGAQSQMLDVNASTCPRTSIATVQHAEIGSGIAMCQDPDGSRSSHVPAVDSTCNTPPLLSQQKHAVGGRSGRRSPQFVQPFGVGPVKFGSGVTVPVLAHPMAVTEPPSYGALGARDANGLGYTAVRIVHAADSTPASLLAKVGQDD